MHAAVVLGGDADSAHVREALSRVDLVVAADRGADHVASAGGTCDVVVGDHDSVTPMVMEAARATGVDVMTFPAEKDATDGELALREAVRRGASSITIMGALGGPRLDHLLGNVALLTHPVTRGVDVWIEDAAWRLWIATGSSSWVGVAGDGITLLPVGGNAIGVTTRGLRYGLHEGAISHGASLGMSNEMTGPHASIDITSGSILVIHNRHDASGIAQVEQLKSDFVSFVSHELRTPLSLIKGYVSTLLRPGLTLAGGTQERFLHGISDAADRLAAIVNNLLNASRIESGLFVPRLRVVDLHDVVASVVVEMRPHAAGRISLVGGDAEAFVRVDEEHMRLVISNMIGNSIRHAIPQSDDPIVVTLKSSDHGYSVQVSDTGPGISADDLPHIFEKFYRGTSDGAAPVPGSGLGLYICQNIVEAHGGRIWAESSEGEGATIGFRVPAVGDVAKSNEPGVFGQED